MECKKDKPIFPISIAAKLVGVSTKMLRIYEEQDLIMPKRTPDKEKIRGRRLYSQNDIDYLLRLRELISKKITLESLTSFYDFYNFLKKSNKNPEYKQEFFTEFYEFIAKNAARATQTVRIASNR